jgi:anti-sigma factor RsiW
MSPNFNDKSSSSAVGVDVHDRFELLSAYIDGEVTATERRQVEAWLATDPAMQRLYSRLMKLHQAFEALPEPEPQQSSQQIAEAVFDRVERRSRRRWLAGGVAAVVTLAVGALALLVPGERSLMPQMAEDAATDQPVATTNSNQEPLLLIALEKPLVDIPKAPVAQEVPVYSLPKEDRNSAQ